MGSDCNKKLSDKNGVVPDGLKLFYEENKIPIGVSLVAVGSVALYGILKKKNSNLSDYASRKRKSKTKYLQIAKSIQAVIDECDVVDESMNYPKAKRLLKQIGVAKTERMKKLKIAIKRAMEDRENSTWDLNNFLTDIYLYTRRYDMSQWLEEEMVEFFEN